MRRSRPGASAGFTMIELVMVILIVGALAVAVMPKVVDVMLWRLRSFGDDMQGRMQEALRLSLQQRRPITATISPTGVSFAYASGASLGSLPCPAGATPCITTGTGTATFNNANLGQTLTSAAAGLSITVASGSYSQTYRLENMTGVMYRSP